ncbi:hypothetical protein BHM03_00057181 [Ensete ventricosum]|nr:hypothetical protein BHM03_00057181 [Ensete ventricosum]
MHGKSYEHGFTNKRNGHKLSRSREQSQVSIGFSCTVLEIQNTGQSQCKKTRRSYTLCEVARSVEFRSVFHVPSQKFKILSIPDVLARGKSYEHYFMKKRNGYTLCAKSRVESSFDRFFVHHLGNSKYWPFLMY